MQERLVAEKKEAVAALEQRIRALEGGAGAERQDLAAQLQAVQRALEECAANNACKASTLFTPAQS
jgi:hypothetical protein